MAVDAVGGAVLLMIAFVVGFMIGVIIQQMEEDKPPEEFPDTYETNIGDPLILEDVRFITNG